MQPSSSFCQRQPLQPPLGYQQRRFSAEMNESIGASSTSGDSMNVQAPQSPRNQGLGQGFDPLLKVPPPSPLTVDSNMDFFNSQEVLEQLELPLPEMSRKRDRSDDSSDNTVTATIASTSTATIAEVSAPDFVKKLYSMVGNPHFLPLVYWTGDGDSFIITNQVEFSRVVLPALFKHSNFSSFVRQLNKYDFHKVRNSELAKKLGSKAWEFRHPFFLKSAPNLLKNIRRKNRASSAKDTAVKEHSRTASSTANDSDREEGNLREDVPLCHTTLTSPAKADIQPAPSADIQGGGDGWTLQAQVNYLVDQQLLTHQLINSLSEKYRDVVQELSGLRAFVSSMQSSQSVQSQVDTLQQSRSQPTESVSMANTEMMAEVASSSMVNLPNIVSFVTPSLTPSTNLSSLSHGRAKSYPNIVATCQRPVPTAAPSWMIAPRVLLVEDDPTCRHLSSKLLQIFGCSFDVAPDGLVAVSKMNLDHYDLVLMDIVMPNLDGVSATYHIRKFDQLTPIISMTSNTTETDCRIYMSTGMTDILAKPFSKANLRDILTRYCSHLKASAEHARNAQSNYQAPGGHSPQYLPNLFSLSSPARVEGTSDNFMISASNSNASAKPVSPKQGSNDDNQNPIPARQLQAQISPFVGDWPPSNLGLSDLEDNYM
eukprot:Partr_v1_DN28945_c0_g1_i2_m24932 putative response regulator